MTPKRIDSLNGLRGLAAMTVALEHFVLLLIPTQPTDLKFRICVILGATAVGVFFLISGFVTPIAFAATGPRDFLVRRVFRLYPVFFVCCLARLAMLIAMDKVPVNLATLKLFLLSVSLFGGLFVGFDDLIEPVVWTLAIEIKFYLMCALLIWLARRSWPAMNRLVLGTLALLGLLAFNFPGIGPPWTGDLGFAVSIIPFMCGGLFVSLHFNRHISAGDMRLGLVCSASVFFMAPMRYFMTINSMLPSFAAACMVFGVALVYRDSLRFLSGRLLTFLGSISYPMYGIHSAVAMAAYRFTPSGKLPLKLAVYLTGVVAASYVIHRLIEIPCIDFSKRLTPRRAPLLDPSPSLSATTPT